MFTRANFWIFFSLFLLNSFWLCFGQSSNPNIWLDETIGIESSGLLNGKEHVDPFIVKNERHRYYKASEFVLGSVNYNGQQYLNRPFRYDLYEDKLMCMLKTSTTEQEVVLLKEKIESFQIGVSVFENLNFKTADGSKMEGFYQLLSANKNVKVYKKHKKKVLKRLDAQTTYFEFFEERPEYFLKARDTFYKLKNLKSLKVLYPKYKKEISKVKWSPSNVDKNDAPLISIINQLDFLINRDSNQ